MTTTRAIGAAHEDAAARHLERAGLSVLARNVTCRVGEIDIVLRDRELLVFAEVRYRRDADFGSAFESVDARKQRRLVAAARWYLGANPQLAETPCRFDVIAVTGAAPYRIEWLRDAFRVDG